MVNFGLNKFTEPPYKWDSPRLYFQVTASVIPSLLLYRPLYPFIYCPVLSTAQTLTLHLLYLTFAMTDTINKTLLNSVLTSIHISIHKQFFVIPSPLRPQVKFFSKLVWDVSLMVCLCTHQLSFGPLTNVAVHLEVGISPWHCYNIVIPSPPGPLVRFFQNFSGMFPWLSSYVCPILVLVHPQIWVPLAIFDFSPYHISSITSGGISSKFCIWISLNPLDVSQQKWFQSVS